MPVDGDGPSALEPRRPERGGGRAYGPTEQTVAEIVDLLSDVRALQEEAGRSILVHAIGEALGEPIMVPAVPNPRFFLYYLVLNCQDFPEGMDVLVKTVEFIAGHTVAVSRLRRLVSPAQDLLEPAVETQVEEFLTGLRVPSLPRLYHAAVGGSVAPEPRHLDDAWDAFSVLLDHNSAPDRPPPHLAFVAMLLQALKARDGSPEDARRAHRLREWLGVEIDVLRAGGATAQADELVRMRDRPEPIAIGDEPIYLIIQLEPVPELVEGDTMCRLSHWRQVDPLGWRPVPGEDKVVPFRTVPEHVAELIREAEGGWAYQFDDNLVLEFVLPYEMINLALDQWTRDPPESPYPTPLGTEYEIVVRSYERLHMRDLHRAWRQRWRVLADAIECVTYWAGAQDSIRRMGDLLQTSSETVACVLSGPPDRQPGRSELEMALRAGIPVVLWHRTDESDEDLKEVLRDVVGRTELVKLPKNIKRLRGTAPSGHLARKPMQVTLLWDDPNHFLDEPEVLRHPERQNVHRYG
jgi:vWA-MoxR associated protein C-terminal domain/Effector-associated domain 2/vWA-MoxR associated protein middle region 0